MQRKSIDEAALKVVLRKLVRTDPAARRALAGGAQFSIETGGHTKGAATTLATLCDHRFTGTLSVDRASGAVTLIRQGDPGATERVSDLSARAFDALIRGAAGPENEAYGFTVKASEPTSPATAASELAHRRLEALEGAQDVAAELRRTGRDELATAVLDQARETWL